MLASSSFTVHLIVLRKALPQNQKLTILASQQACALTSCYPPSSNADVNRLLGFLCSSRSGFKFLKAIIFLLDRSGVGSTIMFPRSLCPCASVRGFSVYLGDFGSLSLWGLC